MFAAFCKIIKGDMTWGFSLYEASVPVYIKQLNALSVILDKAAVYADQRKLEPAALLQARLYPRHASLRRPDPSCLRSRSAGAARLSGLEPAKIDDKQTMFADLQALIGSTVESIKQIDPQKMRGWRIARSPFRLASSK
jgi:hypothetical protein